MKFPKIGQEPAPPLVDLAESVRKVSSGLLRVHGTHPDLDWARQSLDEVAERLAAIGSHEDAPRILEQHDAAETRPYYFPGALTPRVHVAAPWMTAEQEETRRYGSVRFELIHEGPPTCVHGGFVAWMFDQAFGQHVVSKAFAGPTHNLSVTYRQPSPIQTELNYEVHTEKMEERKLFLSGTLRNGETLLAEASALFVRPRSTL